MRWTASTAVLLLASLIAFAAAAGEKRVFGWVEKGILDTMGVELKVKLDSGALTSSMHASEIERFQRDGEEWVRFVVDVENEATGESVVQSFERPLYRMLKVYGAGGSDRRPVVLMRICLGERIYEEQFSLRDRSKMNYPILLGRRTIQHLGLLDVSRTFTHEPNCDADSPVSEIEGREPDEDIGV